MPLRSGVRLIGPRTSPSWISGKVNVDFDNLFKKLTVNGSLLTVIAAKNLCLFLPSTCSFIMTNSEPESDDAPGGTSSGFLLSISYYFALLRIVGLIKGDKLAWNQSLSPKFFLMLTIAVPKNGWLKFEHNQHFRVQTLATPISIKSIDAILFEFLEYITSNHLVCQTITKFSNNRYIASIRVPSFEPIFCPYEIT